jgi:hypothetical protein
MFATVLLFIKFSEYNLTNKSILLNAKTINWAIGANMSMNLKYEFYYKGNKIIDNNASGSYRGHRIFENKYFPVMYDPILGTSKLLIEPSDFKRFNLPFPDSLKWVLKYLKQ